jgi:hypothetical protein
MGLDLLLILLAVFPLTRTTNVSRGTPDHSVHAGSR